MIEGITKGKGEEIEETNAHEMLCNCCDRVNTLKNICDALIESPSKFELSGGDFRAISEFLGLIDNDLAQLLEFM